MAKKTERITVGSDVYDVAQLDTDAGLMLYAELLRIVGPAFGKLAEGTTVQGDVEALFVRAVLMSVSSLTPEFLTRLSRQFAKQSKVRAMAGSTEMWVELNGEFYDAHFAGRFKHWTSWVMSCLALNFADFFPAAAASASAPPAAAGTTSP